MSGTGSELYESGNRKRSSIPSAQEKPHSRAALSCAGSGNRTRTALRPQNFKSCVATNYTIPAVAKIISYLPQCARQYTKSGLDFIVFSDYTGRYGQVAKW